MFNGVDDPRDEYAADHVASGERVVHWRLEDLDPAVMARHSLIALAGGSLVAGLLAGWTSGPVQLTWTFAGILVVVAVVGSLLALVLHEGLHGLVMALFGASPRFGAGLMKTPEVDGRKGGKVPYLFATAPGHRFTPRQMNWVAMVPTFVISAALLGLIMALPGPWGLGLALPAGLHLSGCVGDWHIFGLLRRQPPGTTVEDTRDGMILHLPGSDESGMTPA